MMAAIAAAVRATSTSRFVCACENPAGWVGFVADEFAVAPEPDAGLAAAVKLLG
jgi:hypothetical protein